MMESLQTVALFCQLLWSTDGLTKCGTSSGKMVYECRWNGAVTETCWFLHRPAADAETLMLAVPRRPR